MVRIGGRLRAFATSARLHRLRDLAERASKSYVVIVIVGVVIGLQVAPVVTSWTGSPVAGSVAVIPIEGSITGGSAVEVASMLEEAREDPQVDAVVLSINSPGGSAPASETLYLAVKRTAAEMPVVASVDAMSASGAYYAMAPADAIYVKPASLVGSIGVIFQAPAPIAPIDGVVTTGPSKLTGAEQREWEYKVESLRRAFVGAVVQSRGDRLKISAGEISQAKLYTGAEVVENGLADEIGGLRDAIDRAGAIAGVANPRVLTMQRTGTVSFLTRANFLASNAPNKQLVGPEYFLGSADAPGVSVGTALMLPPEILLAERAGPGAASHPGIATESAPPGANATTAPEVADGE